jgi:hypothetical protein
MPANELFNEISFVKVDEDTYEIAEAADRRIAPRQTVADAFFAALRAESIDPNRATRIREPAPGDRRQDMYMQAAFVSARNRVVCDASIVESLKAKGFALNIRP